MVYRGKTARRDSRNLQSNATPRWQSPDVQQAALLDPPSFSLDDDGMIEHCSDVCASIFGYDCKELESLHISSLFPQLSGLHLVTDGRLNPLLDFLCRCDHVFVAHKREGGTVKCALSLVKLIRPSSNNLRLIIRPLE